VIQENELNKTVRTVGSKVTWVWNRSASSHSSG